MKVWIRSALIVTSATAVDVLLLAGVIGNRRASDGASQLKRSIKRHGLAGTGRRVGERLAKAIYLTEAHAWYELDLGGERPHFAAPEGIALVEAMETNLLLIEQLPSIHLREAQRRYVVGATLWLALEDKRPVFACWIFRDQMPLHGRHDGAIRLPPRTVGLEDSVAAPDRRGRGIAPWAWSVIGDQLRAARVESMLTKVALENVPSRRAVEKAGFRQIAVMTLVRYGRTRKITLEHSGDGCADSLATSLTAE